MSVQRYLKRMDESVDDKLKVLHLLPDNAEYVLDVGCAAGGVTSQMAINRRSTHFHGIDVELPFIGMASKIDVDNVSFSHNWLSDLHKYDTRYDAVMFMSVLHEFYSYGNGMTSVIKALCDAHELLKPGGRIIIRDMWRDKNDANMLDIMTLYEKLSKLSSTQGYLWDYEKREGKDIGTNVNRINDFLLHMQFTDNWKHEIQENYMFWTVRECLSFASQFLGMRVVHNETYLLDYTRELWNKKYWLNDVECDILTSTAIIALEK